MIQKTEQKTAAWPEHPKLVHYYWYKTLSGLHPPDFIFYINFQYVALKREAEPKEIDRYRLVELGSMSRERFGEEYSV